MQLLRAIHYEHSMECNSLAERSRLYSLQIFLFIWRFSNVHTAEIQKFFMMWFKIWKIMFQLLRLPWKEASGFSDQYADGKAARLSLLFRREYFHSGLLPTVNGLRFMSVTQKNDCYCWWMCQTVYSKQVNIYLSKIAF